MAVPAEMIRADGLMGATSGIRGPRSLLEELARTRPVWMHDAAAPNRTRA